MVSYKIMEVKAFMAKLLASTAFDGFILKEMELDTFTSFKISGQLNEDFFSKDELEARDDTNNVYWSEVKPIAYNMIKGNRTPLSLKVVLQLANKQVQDMADMFAGKLRTEDIGGLFLNIRFEKGELRIITGVAIKTFLLDKTLEHEWDARVSRMLKDYGIAFETES